MSVVSYVQKYDDMIEANVRYDPNLPKIFFCRFPVQESILQ